MGVFTAVYLLNKRDFLQGKVKAFARGVSDFDANDVLAYLIEIGKSVDMDDCDAILLDLTEQGDLVSFESDGSQRWRVP
jgi:hypothetical protein